MFICCHRVKKNEIFVCVETKAIVSSYSHPNLSENPSVTSLAFCFSILYLALYFALKVHIN